MRVPTSPAAFSAVANVLKLPADTAVSTISLDFGRWLAAAAAGHESPADAEFVADTISKPKSPADRIFLTTDFLSRAG